MPSTRVSLLLASASPARRTTLIALVKEMTALYNSCITGDTRCRDEYYGFITAYHASKADFNDNIYGIYVLKYLLQRKGLCSANVTMPFFRNEEKDRSIERFCEAFNI